MNARAACIEVPSNVVNAAAFIVPKSNVGEKVVLKKNTAQNNISSQKPLTKITTKSEKNDKKYISGILTPQTVVYAITKLI